MKRNIIGRLWLLGLVFWLLAGPAQAQIYQKGDWNVGFDGGIQFTSITDDLLYNTPNTGIGYTLGPFVEYHISPEFKFRLGMQFDRRAFDIEEPPYAIYDTAGHFENSYIQIKRDYDINFLTIPVSAVYVKGTDQFKIFIQLTFYYSLYLSAYQTGTNDLYIAPEDYQNVSDSTLTVGHNIFVIDEPVEQGFNSYDMGFNIFIGGLIKLSPSLALSISPGFTVGLANVYEDPNRKSKWSRIMKVNAGIVYKLKKK